MCIDLTFTKNPNLIKETGVEPFGVEMFGVIEKWILIVSRKVLLGLTGIFYSVILLRTEMLNQKWNPQKCLSEL